MHMDINFTDFSLGDMGYEYFPKLARVRQNFDIVQIDDLAAAVKEQFAREKIASQVKEGMTVAVLVGSRGIHGLSTIVRTTIDELKRLGAKPFIVPAMGSHGGATPEGQKDLLASYNVTEESMGVEIHAGMEAEVMGRTDYGVNVYFSKEALKADAVLPINKIKLHTDFRGKTESGIIKLMTIGAGKQAGAESLHYYGGDMFATLLPDAYNIIVEKVNVLFGIGVVENANEHLAIVEAIPTENIYQRESELLEIAKKYMARILVEEFDALIVGACGKNFSGYGMDPNITGRFTIAGLTGGPKYQRLALLSVSEESHGNAQGIGLADIIPESLLKECQFQHMYMNGITSKMTLELSKVPIVAKDDRDAIALMLRTCVRVEKGKERVVAIPNTLKLQELLVSESLLEEIKDDPRFTILEEPKPMEFDENGKFTMFRK